MPPNSIDGLIELLASGAGVSDHEAVSVLAHGLQCAAILHDRFPDDEELIVAGLVHDVADIVDRRAHARHDEAGADLVRPLLGDRVAALVGAHVLAKRYLVSIEPGYGGTLSARSIETLGHQGGPLGDTERRELEARPDWAAAVALRRADDEAKDPGAVVPDPDWWRPVLERVAASARSGRA